MANNLVTVGDFVFVPEAEAARLHLQEEGIPAFLSNAELLNMDWFLGNATGYVKILVSADQAIAARNILETLQSQKQARRQNRFTTGDASVCLSCGEPLPADQSTCAACGWSYAGDNDEHGAVVAPVEPGDPVEEEAALSSQAVLEKDERGSVPGNELHGDEGLDEAAEDAETNATNVRLLIALVGGGAIVLWLMTQLRAVVRSWL